jgi:hypothetical protein
MARSRRLFFGRLFRRQNGLHLLGGTIRHFGKGGPFLRLLLQLSDLLLEPRDPRSRFVGFWDIEKQETVKKRCHSGLFSGHFGARTRTTPLQPSLMISSFVVSIQLVRA